MNALRQLYHLARADFLERTRRKGFVLFLALTIAAGYLAVPPLDAGYATLDLDGYRGIYNSAWVASLLAMLASLFLWFFGFYLVKNTIQRDERTGVGQILAAMPLRRTIYILGKWLSNLAVLAAMVGLLVVAALAMQLIRGEVLHIEPWALLSPFLFVMLPTAALVAALALLFEVIPVLRSGLGNVIYFFLSIGVVMSTTRVGLDLLGIDALESSITAALETRFPGSGGSFGVGFVPYRGRLAEWLESTGYVTLPDSIQEFYWEGITWTSRILWERVAWVGIALALVLLAAWLFDRFDPARRALRTRKESRSPGAVAAAGAEASLSHLRLSKLAPLGTSAARFQFGQVVLAELRLMFRHTRWWWRAIMAGLILASLLAPEDYVRQIFLPICWLWPVTVWSAMGAREETHHTDQLVFSAAHPLRRQLLALWLAGVIVALFAGSGALLRLLGAADGPGLVAWTVGALFIPTLALALGAWSGTSKAFEVVYTVLWYAGPMNQLWFLDFMGAVEGSVAAIAPWRVLALTGLLFGLAVAGRQRQLRL